VDLAPIVLFVYNRPLHTRQTIEALQQNELAKDSELYIYCDGIKTIEDEGDDFRELQSSINAELQSSVNAVREYVHLLKTFKKVTIIERDRNWGLAASIIDGVSSVVKKHGKIIVLEDDIVTSPYFLKYMNEALDFYEEEDKTWHISGWNYPVKVDSNDESHAFLWQVMNCWGWATWQDKWKYYEKNAKKLIGEFSKQEIEKFNLDGIEDFWGQVLSNDKGETNTWAIFWYATIFKNGGLCLNPVQTFVDNIGIDGSGINCHHRKSYVDNLNCSETICFPADVIDSTKYREKIKKLLTTGAFHKLKRFLTW